jgi:hypothetical protein
MENVKQMAFAGHRDCGMWQRPVIRSLARRRGRLVGGISQVVLANVAGACMFFLPAACASCARQGTTGDLLVVQRDLDFTSAQTVV